MCRGRRRDAQIPPREESRSQLHIARSAKQSRAPHLQAGRADGVPAGAGDGAAALGRGHPHVPGTQVRAAALEPRYAQAAGAGHAGGAEAGRHHVLGTHPVDRRPGPPQAGRIVICDGICIWLDACKRSSCGQRSVLCTTWQQAEGQSVPGSAVPMRSGSSLPTRPDGTGPGCMSGSVSRCASADSPSTAAAERLEPAPPPPAPLAPSSKAVRS